MSPIGGFDYHVVEFTKGGALFDEAQVADLVRSLRETGITDLYVASHGWNNDKADADKLYRDLFGRVSAKVDASAGGRRVGVVGVLWPSIRFDDADLIPGGGEAGRGAAGLGDRDAGPDGLKRRLREVHPGLDREGAVPIDRLEELADRLDQGTEAQREFVDAIRSCLPGRSEDPADGASDLLLTLDGSEIFDRLSAPVLDLRRTPGGGGSLGIDEVRAAPDDGGALGLGDILSGARAAAFRFLNLATYYQMKERAGIVGSGLGDVLASLKAEFPGLRLHLVGHSFGARLVTAAAKSQPTLAPASLCLLQGAFSHNGFTSRFDGSHDGFFRQVFESRLIDGPIVATHTFKDKAVGIAYALASRLAGDNAKGIGDENDPFGGIGRNGAVRMAAGESVEETMKAADEAYTFAARKVTNLRADPYIESHGDVTNAAVANVVRRVAGL